MCYSAQLQHHDVCVAVSCNFKTYKEHNNSVYAHYVHEAQSSFVVK